MIFAEFEELFLFFPIGFLCDMPSLRAAAVLWHIGAIKRVAHTPCRRAPERTYGPLLHNILADFCHVRPMPTF